MALQDAFRIPRATYRIQLNPQFTFADLEQRAEYLAKLGISDCYTSPILQSSPGSTHGYDVANYRRINPDLGGEPAFMQCANRLKEVGLGLLVDFVPNHMGISGPMNAWWNNVLENGPHSPYAKFFDVSWRSMDGGERPHILVPVLEDHYGVVLEKGALRVKYEEGQLRITLGELHFPLNASAYAAVLARLAADPELPAATRPAELNELLHAFHRLGPAASAGAPNPEVPVQLKELKKQLASLVAKHGLLRGRLEAQLTELNGRPGEPASFDALDKILTLQSYRLARWKTGIYAINYRRFFAIDTLIGLRMENAEVFAESHALMALLIKEGKITGLRIDHIDGLWNPQQYLAQLQSLRPGAAEGQPDAPFYVVVEKILERGENLPEDWATHGTTGYEFITECAGLLVRRESADEFTALYREFTGSAGTYPDLVYAKKRLILSEMFVNTLTQLTGGLFSLLVTDRHWRDLTRAELAIALRELIAAFPVYRTYRRLGEPCSPQDRQFVEQAYQAALARNPRFDLQTLEIVRDVIIGAYPPAEGTAERKVQLARWVFSFQQYTGAIMAKSVEDTVFFVYNRLIALNEVGGEPSEFGLETADFHAANRERRRQTPQGLIATSTHDNKLSEDVRARLYPLSEIPEEWRAWLREWREMNSGHKSVVDGHEAPDANEEYHLYQALLGAWPLAADTVDETFRDRIKQYFRKAVNEAKLNTTWVEPNDAWLNAGDRFIDRMLSPETGQAFIASIVPRAARLAHYGMVNSLCQTVLKLTCPGVPDFYQGNEVWDFSLVDPDNRRPVDFQLRSAMLEAVAERKSAELLLNWRDGGIKLRVIRDLLHFRGDHPALFSFGDYTALELTGPHAGHAAAFCRRHEHDCLVVVVPRQTAKIGCPPVGPIWAETALTLPDELAGNGLQWQDLLTWKKLPAAQSIPLATLFADLPICVLYVTLP
jgi:(1->4)-alpha-D-glucan 1-alpha-D-glucosylmutase